MLWVTYWIGEREGKGKRKKKEEEKETEEKQNKQVSYHHLVDQT